VRFSLDIRYALRSGVMRSVRCNEAPPLIRFQLLAITNLGSGGGAMIERHGHGTLGDRNDLRGLVQVMPSNPESARELTSDLPYRPSHTVCMWWCSNVAKSYLTRCLFRQILARIERLAWLLTVMRSPARRQRNGASRHDYLASGFCPRQTFGRRGCQPRVRRELSPM